MPDTTELPGVVRDDQTQETVDECRREHDRHEARLGPTVKNVAGEDEPRVPPALARAPKRVIAEERDRQKIINENVRAKNHGGWIARSVARWQKWRQEPRLTSIERRSGRSTSSTHSELKT